jgi:hypothetical protein
MWAKIFHRVYTVFRGQLAKIRPVRVEEDRWISYGLSYVALRPCIRLGVSDRFSYVYTVCLRDHWRHLRRFEARGLLPLDNEVVGAADPVSDLFVDFQEVLRRFRPDDALICRLHLVEDRPLAEIAAMLPGSLDRSTLKRKFDRCLPVIQEALRAYSPAGWMDGTTVQEEGRRAA